jgi:hypothetical protein
MKVRDEIVITVAVVGIGIAKVCGMVGLIISVYSQYETPTTVVVNNGITTTEIIKHKIPHYSTTVVVNGDTTTTEIIEK